MAQVNSTVGRLKSQRGAELIEMALILPLLLLILVGIVDFGFLFQRYEVLTNATREGARLAVLQGYNTADVQNRVCQYLTTGGVPTTGCPNAPTNPTVTVVATTIAVPVGPPVNARKVTLVYTHNFMFIGPIIGLMGGSWTNAKAITIEATMRTEM
jgi:Flp pilus assembly protein TadG